jgi:hypothetical protein
VSAKAVIKRNMALFIFERKKGEWGSRVKRDRIEREER